MRVTGAFLDLSKAFDSINHKVLLWRLENIGFDEHATNLKKNYLNERSQSFVLNGIESDWINLKRGVPQGIFRTFFYLTFTSRVSKDCRKGLHGRPVCRRHFSFYIRH